MARFRKPYMDDVFPAAAKACVYPYSTAMLRRHDVFPLFVLDGGAFFFTREHLGCASGSAFLVALRDGALLRPWLVDGRVHWDKAYDDTYGSPCRTTFEKHVWLNRLYFLLPIAQEAFRTRDEKWARLWYRYFADWLRAHPHRFEVSAQPREPGNYCWFDMQITWRLLVLIHSVRLLEKSRFLKRTHWRRIYKAIHLHSRCLYEEAHADVVNGTGRGNHFLQKGVALLYTGVLFPELPESIAFRETGTAIVKQQSVDEILPDGGSVEASPSYSHFIARLYLDAYMLLWDNGHASIPGLCGSIQRQYSHLAALASPQGLTLQISDSYALDVRQDLAIVRELFPSFRTCAPRSRCFRDSCIAVLWNSRFSVYLDGMPTGLWHHHMGKPNVLVFVDGMPLLVDSGCGDYDSDLRESWLQTAAAHNVVVVVPLKGAERGRQEAWSESQIVLREFGKDRVVMEHRVRTRTWHYTWTRTLLLRRAKVAILDHVRASVPARVEQHFHMGPLNVSVAGGKRKAVARIGQGDVIIGQTDASGGGPFDVTYRPAIGTDNGACASAELLSTACGTDVHFEVEIVAPPGGSGGGGRIPVALARGTGT